MQESKGAAREHREENRGPGGESGKVGWARVWEGLRGHAKESAGDTESARA